MATKTISDGENRQPRVPPQRAPIISVKEARKLLGVGSKSLTNDEVLTLVEDYETLARQAIREYLVRK